MIWLRAQSTEQSGQPPQLDESLIGMVCRQSI